MKKIFVLMAIGVMILGFSGTSARANGTIPEPLVFTENSSTDLTVKFEDTSYSATKIGTDQWMWTPPELIGVPTGTILYWAEPEFTPTNLLVNEVTQIGSIFFINSDVRLTPDDTIIYGNNTTVTGVVTIYNGSVPVAVTFNDISDVPEPATLLLFGSGLVGLVAYRMRSKKA